MPQSPHPLQTLPGRHHCGAEVRVQGRLIRHWGEAAHACRGLCPGQPLGDLLPCPGQICPLPPALSCQVALTSSPATLTSPLHLPPLPRENPDGEVEPRGVANDPGGGGEGLAGVGSRGRGPQVNSAQALPANRAGRRGMRVWASWLRGSRFRSRVSLMHTHHSFGREGSPGVSPGLLSWPAGLAVRCLDIEGEGKKGCNTRAGCDMKLQSPCPGIRQESVDKEIIWKWFWTHDDSRGKWQKEIQMIPSRKHPHLKPWKTQAEWIKTHDLPLCCLQEARFKSKDTNRLKVKG